MELKEKFYDINKDDILFINNIFKTKERKRLFINVTNFDLSNNIESIADICIANTQFILEIKLSLIYCNIFSIKHFKSICNVVNNIKVSFLCLSKNEFNDDICALLNNTLKSKINSIEKFRINNTSGNTSLYGLGLLLNSFNNSSIVKEIELYGNVKKNENKNFTSKESVNLKHHDYYDMHGKTDSKNQIKIEYEVSPSFNFTEISTCQTLRALNLSNNKINDVFLNGLLMSIIKCLSLATLNLAKNEISSQGYNTLSLYLIENKSLKNLDISYNKTMNISSFYYISISLKFTVLEEIILDGNNISSLSFNHLSNSLNNKNNKKPLGLSLNDNRYFNFKVLEKLLFTQKLNSQLTIINIRKYKHLYWKDNTLIKLIK